MTNQEKNEAVDRKLLDVQRDMLSGKDIFLRDGKAVVIPDYCTSIDAAWGIVEKIPKFQMAKDYRGIWCVGSGWQDEWSVLGEASTAPMAIVDAFLKVP